MTDTGSKRRWPRVLAVLALLLLAAGGAGALLLDRFLTSTAREQAAALSVRWGRPVEIGSIRTTLLTGLGVRVDGIRIGAAPGEPRPLLELDRAEVKVALLKALLSGGKEVRVRSAELQGLRVAVVKLPDGSTNAERLSEAMARAAPPERSAAKAAPPKPTPKAAGDEPADLSVVHVEHAALLEARIAFVDASGKELVIDALDLVVDGLAAGAPLDVVLKAGVLSPKQNLGLRVHAPPLPATLAPSPDRIALKVAPIDLTPLAPFLPKGAGFQGGRFAADLDVVLGGAVPGGAGPTRVRGGFAATGLRFAGQEGGKALDVTLDADLAADAARGDLTIGRLLLAFGPASLAGTGKVTALLSGAPRIDGLRIVSKGLDLAALAPYYPPLPRLVGGTVAGPIALSLEAAGTAERPAAELRLDLTPVRISIPRQLEKAAGGKLSLLARLQGATGGTLRFDAEADLAGVDLRPGGTLAKRPGERLSLSASATRAVAGGVQKLELAALTLGLGDVEVKARGRTELSPSTTRFDLDVEVGALDVDRLLLPAKEEAKPASKEAAPTKGDAAAFAGLSGRASLRIAAVTAKKQRATDVRATVVVKEDEVTVEEGQLGLWDGLFSVAGTRARLAPADRPFRLAAKVEHAQVGPLLGAFTDRKTLEGRIDADVRLSGRGEDADRILKALDGTVEGRLADGVFHGKDLVAEALGPVADAVPALRGKVTKGGTTRMGKAVPVSLRIQGGKALLQKPLEFEERGAATRVQGAFAFDGELDMPTTVTLSPAAVSDLTGGRAKVDAPVPLAFRLVGKAWSPRLSGLDVVPAAKALGAGLGAAAIGKALGLDGTPKEAAKEEAAAVKEKAKEQATEKAGDAAKKLEKEAGKKLRGLFR